MSEHRHAQFGLHAETTHENHVIHAPILRRAKFTSIAIVVCLLLGGSATLFMRILHAQHLANTMEENSKIYVTTVHPQTDAKGEALTLPSTLQGIIEAPIYARSSGYVVKWNKDIGSKVKKHDVLAEIDTPEVDAQLAQAIATKAQAASSLELAKTSAQRWEDLRKKDAVTQQELNERQSAYAQAQANLAAAEANVQRLHKLENFKKVLAPFSGVITRRNIEVGDLVDAGNGGAGRALFSLSKIDPLRLYIYVPQGFAQRIKVGDSVSVTQTEIPDQVFAGKVIRTAGALDAATRTLQMEINLPNRDGQLLAGSYVQVALSAKGAAHVLRVPANVLLFRPEGVQVAVVDATGHVKLHIVTIGHDLGASMEILTGISANDSLVLNPADSLAENDLVIVKNETPTKPAEKAHS